MRTKSITAYIKAIAACMLFSVFFGCAKDVSQQQKNNSVSNSMVNNLSKNTAHAPYDLDVILYGKGNNGAMSSSARMKTQQRLSSLTHWWVI